MVSTPLKNISQNGNLPQNRAENKTYLKPPPRWKLAKIPPLFFAVFFVTQKLVTFQTCLSPQHPPNIRSPYNKEAQRSPGKRPWGPKPDNSQTIAAGFLGDHFEDYFLVTIVGFLWSNFSDGFLVGYPSWNLAYPIPRHFWRWFFCSQGWDVLILEGKCLVTYPKPKENKLNKLWVL